MDLNNRYFIFLNILHKFAVENIGTRFGDPPFLFIYSSLLWDVFIINSVEQLQTLPLTEFEIDISPFLKQWWWIKKNLKRGVHKTGTYGWKLQGQINYFLATFRSGYYFPLKLATYIKKIKYISILKLK